MNDLIARAERELLYQRQLDLQSLLEQFKPRDLRLEEVLALIGLLRPVAERVSTSVDRSEIRPSLRLVP